MNEVAITGGQPASWIRITRTLLPSYGARANAADGLRSVRRDRREHAEAAAAVMGERQPAFPPRQRGSEGSLVGSEGLSR